MFSENGVSRQLLCRVKVNGRVVHLGVGLLQHPYNLATGPDYGTVAMGSHHVDGAMAVEGTVEAHA